MVEPWSNIQIAPDDPEIVMIDNFEMKLGRLPDRIVKIRELITRFEVCHFKYREHLQRIKKSIATLVPEVDTEKIGSNHIRHGDDVIVRDITGRSHTGLQYVRALRFWLNDDLEIEETDHREEELVVKIYKKLGDRDPDKVHFIKLLLARLNWDWVSYKDLLKGGRFKAIEDQASRMDICHYAFPGNLDALLEGIGKLKPVEEEYFEGCGSYNNGVKDYLYKEFRELNAAIPEKYLVNNDSIRAWLIACLAKTIKANVQITMPINRLEL